MQDLRIYKDHIGHRFNVAFSFVNDKINHKFRLNVKRNDIIIGK